jgi:hypothetical protein
MARDVFISHSAHDKAVASAICSALETAGIGCWLAPRDVRPGRSFPGEITRAIRQSKVMVLIFSGHSNNSEQVLREVQLAVDCRLPIIRFRIEDVTLTDDLQYFLSTPHWLDALAPPLSEHITRLELAVKELLGQTAEEAGSNVVPRAAPPVESRKDPEVVPPRPPDRWKLPAIAAGVILGAAIAGMLLWQLARPGIQKHESTPAPVSPPARTPEPTPSAAPSTPENAPSASPKSSPSVSPPGQAGPSLRDGRPWRAWIDDFVRMYVRSNESDDVDLAASFFASRVDLFEEGLKSADAIRRDIETYNARWTTRRATIRGDVQLGEKAPDRSYTASFQPDYYVENPIRGEWINLAVSVDLQISILDGRPKINSLKQKTLRKEKGTMQPRPAPKIEALPGTPSPVAVVTPPAPPAMPASASPSARQTSAAEDEAGLVRVTNGRYGFSALIPQNVFPNPQTSFSTDRQTFSSSDGQTTVVLFVQKSNSSQALRNSYEQWAADHTKTEPAKSVDYKVLRDDWFVVSGEKNGRGFYVKAVAKKDVLVFMHFECDKNNYPVSKDTLTAMSRAFDGK